MRYGRSLIKKANLSDGLFDDIVDQIHIHLFDNTTDTGFIVRSCSNHHAFVFFVTRETSMRTVFNPIACAFDKTEVVEPRVTPILLDQLTGTLEVFGPRSNASEALSTLGKLTGFRLTLQDLHISPVSAIRRMEAARILSHVKGIRVSDWEIAPGIIGNCTIKSVDTFASVDNLRQFGRNIASASVVVTVSGRNVPVGLYRDGWLNIGIDLDEDPEAYAQLKQLVLGGL